MQGGESTRQYTSFRDLARSTKIAYWLLLISYTVLMFVLFANQAFHTEYQVYGSDVDAYLLEMQGIDSGFDFPYPVYFMLGRFFALFTNVNMGGTFRDFAQFHLTCSAHILHAQIPGRAYA